MKNSWRVLILGTILAGLLASGCAFKKGPGGQQSGEADKVIRVTTEESPPETSAPRLDLWDILTNGSVNEMIKKLSNYDVRDLEGIKSPDHKTIMDELALRNMDDAIVYLINRGISPFDASLPEANLFLKKYQDSIMESIHQAALNLDITTVISTATTYGIYDQACFEALKAVEDQRNNKVENSSLETIKSLLKDCQSTLPKFSDSQKEEIFTAEYIYQYKTNFNDPNFATLLAMSLQIHQFIFKDVSPFMLFDLKSPCLSKETVTTWNELLHDIIGLKSPYTIELTSASSDLRFTDEDAWFAMSDAQKEKMDADADKATYAKAFQILGLTGEAQICKKH